MIKSFSEIINILEKSINSFMYPSLMRNTQCASLPGLLGIVSHMIVYQILGVRCRIYLYSFALVMVLGQVGVEV